MKIRRLEIIGFKSFVDKVSFAFPQGITAVVGPNGCGKSNVVDAIRWVMGEQSAKNLRGRSMDDVIFGGSESRKPLGMAEVSIVFSTEDGRVPAKYLDFSEIQVTRRIYRDGEGEYFINRTPCRLLDITELFMDTGVGARAYSIIEQGRIGMILHAKPEERRFLIEEAAGVTKFKAKKRVALKKMDVTRQNLLRLGDIIGELKRQIASLQRQAKKAEKFREYREELKEIELLFAAKSFLTTSAERRRAEEELALLNARAAELAADLEKGDLALEEGRVVLLGEEGVLTSAQEEMYRLKGETQTLEGRREFHRKELENLERLKSRLAGELENLERQLAGTEAERKSLEEHRGLFTVEMGEEEERLAVHQQELDGLDRVEMELSRRLEDARRELFSHLGEMAQVSNQQSAAAKRLAALEERFERNRRETQALREKLTGACGAVAGLEEALGASTGQKRAISQELLLLKERGKALQTDIDRLEREFQAERDELSRKASRLHSLQELESRFEGYGRGVRSLFLADRFRGRFKGMVAELVGTEEQYETALEAALGDRLQHIVCTDADEALEAIAYLQETAGGRGSFIREGSAGPAPEGAPSGAEPLLAKVAATEGHRETIGTILCGTYLVDGLEKAVALGREFPLLTFVTLRGELVSPGCIISGGSSEGEQHGLIHKKREIRELSLEVAALSARVRKLESARDRCKGEAAAAGEEEHRLGQRLHQEDIRLVNTQKDLQRAREEVQRIEERIAVKGLEDDQLGEEKSLLEREIADAGRKMADGEGKREALEGRVASLQEELAARKREIDQVRELLTSLKVRVASLRERRASNLSAIDRIGELGGELSRRIRGHRAELARSEEERGRLEEDAVRIDEELKVLLERCRAAEAAFRENKERYETKAEEVRAEESRLKELRAAAEGARDKGAEKRLRVSELAMALNHLEDALAEKYRLDLAAILPRFAHAEYDEAERRGRQEELRRLIEGLGEVNLLAIEEYRELEERFTFLSSQQSDLNDSLHALQQAIQKINRTTRKRFLETFQQVNAKFQEVFPRLFCGGKGELKLTGEEDLLESGIDIVVQPPGKKLQNVTLLSGGEKALTAVALIFSIFLIKPTPFCLLDEVDAPLDDANIGRFNDMVREMAVSSQFIIITHNRTTMAVADTLYGVTMEEAGVSKTVSVRLN